ncbi:hypothetical protein SK128_004714 [Halocaridina rubra]|uniref:C2H2-type domain-containing protein n=1 Tax=Halocaridina rubra TaxID=373956 RepID=A0AAN8WZM2_HALRR
MTERTRHVCNYCSATFSRSVSLKRHLCTHKKCDDTSYKYGQNEFSYDSDTQGERLHLCSICGVSFKGIGNYRRHLLVYCEMTGPLPHGQCGSTCHVSDADQNPHVCNTCGSGFQCIHKLNRHIPFHSKNLEDFFQIVHVRCLNKSGEYVSHLNNDNSVNSVCDEPLTASSSSSVLINNDEVKEEDRPHLCLVCGISFDFAEEFETHLSSHFEVPDDNLTDTQTEHVDDPCRMEKNTDYLRNNGIKSEDCDEVIKEEHDVDSERVTNDVLKKEENSGSCLSCKSGQKNNAEYISSKIAIEDSTHQNNIASNMLTNIPMYFGLLLGYTKILQYT